MAVVSVRLLPRAERELAALPQATRERLLEALGLLVEFPRLRAAMIGAFQGSRCLVADGGRYRIIYKNVSPRRVDVAYLRHTRKQLDLRSV